MTRAVGNIDTVRVSRAGHTFHERWAARRALQLVFPKDNLHSVVIEGLSPNEPLSFGKEADEIADLVLYYGDGDTFNSCEMQQILQFKYKESAEPVTSSYLKKTVRKFASAVRALRAKVSDQVISTKLSFGFITNAEFSVELWDAIACLKFGNTPETRSAKQQIQYLKAWCLEEKVSAEHIFPLIEFRAATSDLPAQNRLLRRTISDWSADSTGLAARRLFGLVELVREKSQIEGQGRNAIRREDVLDALECDEDQLFPADTRFVDVGEVVERDALSNVGEEIHGTDLPLFLYAEGGVGKTVFIQSLAADLKDTFEVVVFDCFGGGAYRYESQARHLPRVGLLQIVNELATRGFCDPLFPTDSDQYGLIEVARKRFHQASETIRSQSGLQGILIILDAADNAQLEANARGETAFPRLLLASLSAAPIKGVKLLLTARPHRMESVIGNSQAQRFELRPFTKNEAWRFLETRRRNINDMEFSKAFARSKGNARVLEYLVESWDTNVSGSAPRTEISVEELIAQRCDKIFRDLHTLGWSDREIREFFAGLSLLPPPIPLTELAEALGWPESQVNSAASDLAPMLELVKHGAIFRDEPTETYIKDQFANEAPAQQAIAQRLLSQQSNSIYAAEALPQLLVVIGDSNKAYQLAGSNEFPFVIESDYGRRKLRLARLYAAFSLATREKDLDRLLSLIMQLSQVASANARGDEFIRSSPALATILGDSDASRRLFNDRSGWRGARDVRLIVAYSFSSELDEARIHQNRAIGWINWYLNNDDDNERHDRLAPEAADIAAVMFLNVVTNDFSHFNRNIQIWHFRFQLSVIAELIELCDQHQVSTGSQALEQLVKFAASKTCMSVALQIGLLDRECGLSGRQFKVLARGASSLAQEYQKKHFEDSSDLKMKVQSTVAGAAMGALILNSRQSARRLLKLNRMRRPSSHDYTERHGLNNIWIPVQAACVTAWSCNEALSFQHLIPKNVQVRPKKSSIKTEADFSRFLDSLIVTKDPKTGRKGRTPEKQFSSYEQEDIAKSVSCVLKLVEPIEHAVLSEKVLSNDVLGLFLAAWKSELRPDVHWRAKTGRDNVARHVGFGLAILLLRYCETIENKEANELLEIVRMNSFPIGARLAVLALISRRPNLSEVAGVSAKAISDDILKDDYIEQRGNSYRELAKSLLPMSRGEAQEYYTQGLAQLDQMGGDDFDLIYSALHYAAEQPGGLLRPELSHRLMNLCQTIFQHEPSKFRWTLFGSAAASSIGLPAIYKLIRWHDMDIVEYSYALPQLACHLAKTGYMDARRAAVLLAICEDHGWHEWQVGDGLLDLLETSDSEYRAAIFSLVTGKLHQEHTFGGWEGLWDSLLRCLNSYQELDNEGSRASLAWQREAARHRREHENSKYNNTFSHDANRPALGGLTKEGPQERDIADIVVKCDPTSANSLNEAIQHLEDTDGSLFDNRKRLFIEIRQACPFDKRVKFLEAICESDELEFDRTLDLIVESIESWADSTAHVKGSIKSVITRLFAFKGSELFDLRYSGIPRQIYRLSKLCGDSRFVIETVLEAIAKERLELSGDEWLQLATSLSCQTTPTVSLEVFEDLLSSSAAKVGDEIGEGPYHDAFSGKSGDIDVISDIIWHLLGDKDVFVRWNAARSIKGMLELGLTDDVRGLLDRFDTGENTSLATKDNYFAFLNAQQWLLMGLARAALYHGEKLKPLRSRIIELANRSDLHVINKLHLARCLGHIDGEINESPELSELSELWTEINTPKHGIVERDGWPYYKDRCIEFSFEYEFEKYKISDLARLFGVSDNEAADYVAKEVNKLWPSVDSIADLPGGVRYRGDERYETYAEHIQRHALLFAATELVRTCPVVRHSYDWEGSDPWRDFIRGEDISFQDGSWLSDHKDSVPEQAREYLVEGNKRNEETLFKKEALFAKVGFPEFRSDHALPLYGYWTSPDGVHVRIQSALTQLRGAVGRFSEFSKLPFHELWLPSFGSDGFTDRFIRKSQFTPLICDPENHCIGIDQGDEKAARGANTRPKLGKALNRMLRLSPDSEERSWHNRNGMLALNSVVWGESRVDPSAQRARYQDEGAILWAQPEWLDETLKTNKRGLVLIASFSKYKSNLGTSESRGIRMLFVGLKRNGEPPRWLYAKKASEVEF